MQNRPLYPQPPEKADGSDFKKKTVNVRPLKVFAAEKLPDSSLRDVLLSEMQDELNIADFLTMVPIYLRLSRRIKL